MPLHAGFRTLVQQFQSEYLRRKIFAPGDATVHNPKKMFRAPDKTGGDLNRISNNINQIANYINYLEKNNMVEARVIDECNRYFGKFLQVQEEYVKAIRAYLRSMR